MILPGTGQRAGLKFRRQHPWGRYFDCHAAKLIIEVDGEAHNRGNRTDRDRPRDRWFVARGLALPRVAAIDVLADLTAVVRKFVSHAEERILLHHASHGPAPHAAHGEERYGAA